jgi:hypothetical protein
MDLLIVMLVAWVGWWLYRNGRRSGSRAGFSAGRFSRFRRRHK